MRNEREMFDLILHVAKGDERVRGAWLNGSRANPNVPKDRWQDYDIVYLVKAMDSFLADHSWIDVFGERLMLQMPETMRDPLGDGRFTYLILLADGNRIDLTLVPAEKPFGRGQPDGAAAGQGRHSSRLPRKQRPGLLGEAALGTGIFLLLQ